MRQVGIAVALGALSLAGCAPLVVQQGARTVRPGSTQAGMSVDAESSSSDDDGTETRSLDLGMSPNGWVRVGIAESVDAGLQFYGSGIRLDGKYAPVQSEAFAVAVGAGVGGGYSRTKDAATGGFEESTSTSSHYWADVGGFFTARVAPQLDLNVALKYLHGEVSSREETEGEEVEGSSQRMAFGGALGLAFRREHWTISPEVAIWQLQTRETEAPDDDAPPTLVIVPSIGFSVGF